MTQALLELKEVSKAFGGLQCIVDLDIEVRDGEILSVIGPNGAGKTTLFNLITGIYEPDSGDILLDGESLVGLAPHKITNRGVARTFQTLASVPEHERQGERDGRDVRSNPGIAGRVDAPSSARSARRARVERCRRGASSPSSVSG